MAGVTLMPNTSGARNADEAVRSALASDASSPHTFATLISRAAAGALEEMAQQAQAITRRHFGRTISLYVPLYLSSFCPGGCLYCGFASDRPDAERRRLEPNEALVELDEIHSMGFDEVLLLTGERCREADVDYLLECVRLAARKFHLVTIETFAMTEEEYRMLVEAGCTGITLYQETYDPKLYERLHRWGQKRDYRFRLEAPHRALAAGSLPTQASPWYFNVCRQRIRDNEHEWSAFNPTGGHFHVLDKFARLLRRHAIDTSHR